MLSRTLQDALVNETEDHIRAAAAWSLGQVGECDDRASASDRQETILTSGALIDCLLSLSGKHSPDHAEALAQADIFSVLVDIYKRAGSQSADLQTKVSAAVLFDLHRLRAAFRLLICSLFSFSLSLLYPSRCRPSAR